jgi:hypothetical protein
MERIAKKWSGLASHNDGGLELQFYRFPPPAVDSSRQLSIVSGQWLEYVVDVSGYDTPTNHQLTTDS